MIAVQKNKTGGEIDWWFIYKLPKSAGNISKQDPTDSGFQYLYFDSNEDEVHLSDALLTDKISAIELTLAQIGRDDLPDTVGWYYYNDEIPSKTLGAHHDDGTKGHTKGLVIFDTAHNSAIWLLHSTPRWSIPSDTEFPEDERIYGQTYLAITLKDIETAENWRHKC